MLKRSHTLIGAAAGAVLAEPTGTHLAVAIIVGGIAGLAPDIDHPGATAGKFLPKWWHRITPGHRGPTHSILWCALLGLLVGMIQWYVTGAVTGSRGEITLATAGLGVMVGAGAFSHVLADSVTTQGVPFFWPVVRRRQRLPRGLSFPTGGTREQIVTTVVVLATAGWVVTGTDQGAEVPAMAELVSLLQGFGARFTGSLHWP